MTLIEKTAALVSKLIRLTMERQLQWQPRAAAKFGLAPNDRVLRCYETEYEGRRLAISELNRAAYDRYTDSTRWEHDFQLLALDDHGNVQWGFPGIPGLSSLFSAASGEAAGIDAWLDGVLGHAPSA